MATMQPDIIIVGAGTAGLLLADELSKDGTLRVHIIEAGKDFSGHPDTQDVAGWTANLGSERDWQFESVSQSGLNGRTFTQNSGKLLGGSSSINGAYYAAPSRAVVNAWSDLGNATWSWDDFQQACLEAVTIHPPHPNICRGNGLEVGINEVAGTGPVQVSSGLEPHLITNAFLKAVRDLGLPTTTSVFNNSSAGGQLTYFTEDPTTKLRSDANTAYWQPLKQRPNVTISLDTTVKKVILEGTAPNVSAKGVEVVSGTGESSTLLASRETILSAGAFGSPKLLELSGIGQSSLLQRHGIPVVIDNSHVGERLTNHIMCAVHCELASEVEATSPAIRAMAYLPSKNAAGLEDVLRDHQPEAGGDGTYEQQVKNIFLDPKEGSCMHFMGWLGVPNAWTFGVIPAIPFSHGSTHIKSANAKENPIVDPGFFSHPLDIEVMARHLKTAAGFASQPALKGFFKEDAGSLANAGVDEIKEYLRQNAASTYHSVGSASMRPQNDGGVVDEQLRVYGTRNLRVVDASVIPMIAHGNPMAAVYGIAKRAAGMIRETAAAE